MRYSVDMWNETGFHHVHLKSVDEGSKERITDALSYGKAFNFEDNLGKTMAMAPGFIRFAVFQEILQND